MYAANMDLILFSQQGSRAVAKWPDMLNRFKINSCSHRLIPCLFFIFTINSRFRYVDFFKLWRCLFLKKMIKAMQMIYRYAIKQAHLVLYSTLLLYP